MNNNYQEQVHQWFKEAKKEGPVRAPKSLINALGQTQEDLLHLINNRIYNVYNEFYKEFPALNKARCYSPVEIEEKEQVVALLRWFKQPVSMNAEKYGHKAIWIVYLLIAACFGKESLFWNEAGVSANRDDSLANFAENMLLNMTSSFSVPINAPLHEKALLKEWETACKNYDLVSIERLLHSFKNVMIPTPIMEEAVLCLQANAPAKLLNISNKYNNPMQILLVVNLLSPITCLKIAEQTQNILFLFFSLLYGGIGLDGRREINGEIQAQLVKVLLKASEDISFWKQLLSVINKEVYRCPDMQKSLGIALASMSNQALLTYVESLQVRLEHIDNQIPDRADGVEVCISSFVNCSSKEKYKFFLEKLYEKWKSFIESKELFSDEKNSFALFFTNIDCAASYYLKLFSTKKNIRSLLKTVTTNISSFRNIWHSTSVDIGKFLNTELCKFNVYYSSLADDFSICFTYPFSFRVPAYLVENKYMLFLFPYQLDKFIVKK